MPPEFHIRTQSAALSTPRLCRQKYVGGSDSPLSSRNIKHSHSRQRSVNPELARLLRLGLVRAHHYSRCGATVAEVHAHRTAAVGSEHARSRSYITIYDLGRRKAERVAIAEREHDDLRPHRRNERA